MAEVITAAPPRKQVTRDDFCTKGVKGGITFHLGHFKKADPDNSRAKNNIYKHTLLVQDNSEQNHCEAFAVVNKGGIRTTRFGKGFQRRGESDISNPVKDKLTEISKITEERKEHMRESRSDLLKTIHQYNGFNPVTGTPVSQGRNLDPKPEGIRKLGDGLGAEAPLRGNIMLRDSSSRFFIPQYSGPTHEHRQQVLVNEGLLTKKHTSIIEVGKKDLPSYGVEDQFSKSEYTRKPPQATLGLCESRVPGRFTPRKQNSFDFGGGSSGGGGVAGCLGGTYNPSGDPRVTAQWGKGIDLDVRSRTLGQSNSMSSIFSTGPIC